MLKLFVYVCFRLKAIRSREKEERKGGEKTTETTRTESKKRSKESRGYEIRGQETGHPLTHGAICLKQAPALRKQNLIKHTPDLGKQILFS